MKYFYFFILFLFIYNTQIEAKTFTTDRPGQSIAVDTLSAQTFQLQSGITQERFNEISVSNINNIFRYGLNSTFEINTAFDYITLDNSDYGTDNFYLGGRLGLLKDQKFILKSMALQIRNRFSSLGSFEHSENTQEYIVVMQWQSLGAISLLSNYRFQMESLDKTGDDFFSLNVGYQVGPWVLFVEPYWINNDSTVSTFFNFGTSYQKSNSLAFDISVGEKWSQYSSYHFISAGISIWFI